MALSKIERIFEPAATFARKWASLSNKKGKLTTSTAGTEPAKRPKDADPASIAPVPTASGT